MKAQRIESDYYPTPAALTESLLYHCPQLPRLIFAPCTGQGAITEVLRDSDRMVSDSDIAWDLNCPTDATTKEFWDYWTCVVSCMPHFDCRNWATVTNPPFNCAAEILPLAYEHSPWGVAFLLRLSYLEPVGNRAEWLQRHADNMRYMIPINFTVFWGVWQKSWSWRQMEVTCPFVFDNGWNSEIN